MPSRSPILFWLLLAATLAVDAVTVASIYSTSRSTIGGVIFLALALALALSQLSIVCFWSVVLRPRLGVAWFAPFALSVPIAATFAAAGDEPDWMTTVSTAYLGFFWFHVAITLAVLWVLKPTRLLANSKPSEQSWQFALRHLLAVMTCLGILVALMSHNGPIVQDFNEVVAFVLGSVTLLTFAIAAVQRQWAWPLVLAADFAGALAIAEICIQAGVGFSHGNNWRAHFLIQAVVLWAWLELYRPRLNAAAASSESQVSKPMPQETA